MAEGMSVWMRDAGLLSALLDFTRFSPGLVAVMCVHCIAEKESSSESRLRFAAAAAR